jgi:hypothetical protein
MTSKHDRDYDTYRLVRQLVRDNSKSTKEIAELTGYSRAYVSELRREIPWIDEARAKRKIEMAAPDLLQALKDILADPETQLSKEDWSAARFAITKATGEQYEN